MSNDVFSDEDKGKYKPENGQIQLPENISYAEIEAKIFAAIDGFHCTLPQIKSHAGFEKAFQIDGILNGMTSDRKIVKICKGLNPTDEENAQFVAYFRADKIPSKIWLAGHIVGCEFDGEPLVEPLHKIKTDTNGARVNDNSHLFPKRSAPQKEKSKPFKQPQPAAEPENGILKMRNGREINLTEFENALKEGLPNHAVAARAGFKNEQHIMDSRRHYPVIGEIYARAKKPAPKGGARRTPRVKPPEKAKSVAEIAAEIKQAKPETAPEAVETFPETEHVAGNGHNREKLEQVKGALVNTPTFFSIEDESEHEPQTTIPSPMVQTKTVNLSNGKKIFVGFEGNIFDASKEDRAFLNSLVDLTQDFEAKK